MKTLHFAAFAAISLIACQAQAVDLINTSFEAPNNATGFTLANTGAAGTNFVLDSTAGEAHTGTQFMSWAGVSSVSTATMDSPALSAAGIASGSVKVDFWHKFNFETGTSSNFDGGQVQYSLDGVTWTTVLAGDIAGQTYATTPISASFGSPLAGQRAFSGLQSQYVLSTASLTGINSGDAFKVRFLAASDSSVNSAGLDWQIDDLRVYGDAVPEPASMTILALGALAALKRRKSK
jgi:hypothetical protein